MAKTALITGATGGIGGACARRLAADGWHVVASGQNAQRLAALSDATGCQTLRLDLCDAAETIDRLAPVRIDAVLHCAGILGPAGKIYELPPEDVSAVISANVIATINLFRAVLPGMVARKAGDVILAGSVAAAHAGTSPALYAASKAAVSALARDLRFDLHGTGLRVGELLPGRVRTGIHAQLGTGIDLYGGYRCLSPEDIAAAAAFVLTAPPHMDVTGMEIMPTDQILGGSSFHSQT